MGATAAPGTRTFRPAFSGLLPHPPIVVPAVGRERIADCRATTASCREFARRLVAHRPERLLLVSPHSPRLPEAFGLWAGTELQGDLGSFGAPEAAVRLPNDEALAGLIEVHAESRGIPCWRIDAQPLDHGALVPLWFLVEAGWSGPTCIVSLPYPDSVDLVAFGRAVGEAAKEGGGSVALVASGDMTHRAQRGAPAGFHPRAVEFDHELERLVAAGRLEEIGAIDPELRELAAEDAADSALLVAAAQEFEPHGHAVLSYEHPFGVGYMVAVFDDGEPGGPVPAERAAAGLEILPALARRAVEAAAAGRAPAELPEAAGELAARAAVFVTLRTREDGELRGCIGSLEPGQPDLVAEVADRARAAAVDDPRFPPVSPEEVAALEIEVSVLEPSERVDSAADLDPRVYGLIVSDRRGRRGVLLPAIQQVDSPTRQIEIARRKAGIPLDEPVQLRRFRVRKLTENEPA